jgi:hypothetical protein
MAVDEDYKGHRIQASAHRLLDTRQWEPRIRISWIEGKHTESKTPIVIKSFGTRKEAESYGLAFARQWIAGRPFAHSQQKT